jgi:hypothetical protein
MISAAVRLTELAAAAGWLPAERVLCDLKASEAKWE